MAAASELAIEVLKLAAVERRRRPAPAVESPMRPPLARNVKFGAAAALLLIPRAVCGFRRLAGGEKSSGAVRNQGKHGGEGIGFRPASAPQTRSYTASGVTLAGCGKKI